MDTRDRAAHHHPIRRLLNQSIGMRRPPDEQELAGINAPADVIDQVREAAADLVEAADAGGLRSVNKARQAGELIARELAERIPRGYADALPRTDTDTDFDGSAAAERVLERAAGKYPEHSEHRPAHRKTPTSAVGMKIAEATDIAVARLETALSVYGLHVAICEPEDRARPTGRVRVVMTADHARKLADILVAGG
jgi:hypothetical protein